MRLRATEASPKFGAPFNISVMAEASGFKFGTEFEFANSNLKSHEKTKVGVALVWGAPKNLGFPFNIYAVVETSDLKFGTQLEFAN